MYGCANTLVKKLQRVQNFAAKVVPKKEISDSVTESLKQFHWFPTECRIQFKLLVIMLKLLIQIGHLSI